ncbi:hypothetical protein [Mucilaginibacter ginsenosidivorans]|uniref:Uncharacterized protein n=1 Tax=Mucilaginibacter ginsenosidivorans TaxID=398053 RepID=A0A5B8UWE4_9SPHI|nr:hypothetical protein [Mucilaginibacter ginsenosidivorans]QEC62661.1 hypothetical protein FRZ54_08695 [Mucilaginibacter ginsenosidivorans]
MNTHKNKQTKPAENNPVKEARGHPDGPGLMEMINGQEEKKLKSDKDLKSKPDNPDIPII